MLKAPFPWFGGKSRAAGEIWRYLGDVQNYVEPFAGSLAVLLARPHEPKTETVNDIDCYLANFWRAMTTDPIGVAQWADWPVNEADLHARHLWLLNQEEFRERMHKDPDYFDVKIAGWWVWGQSAWIGAGWCAGASSWGKPFADGELAHERLPHLGDAGRGDIYDYFAYLGERLRRVRVACGQWDRVLGESTTLRHGVTGVLLDPPYEHDERGIVYASDHDVWSDVRDWAIENGNHPLLRIALCGYENGEEMPAGWMIYRWKARGGYGSQGNDRGRENAERETIWFSPHCLKSDPIMRQLELIA